MPEESLLDASEEQLIQLANLCYKLGGSALSEEQGKDLKLDNLTKLRLHVEGQFCLTQVMRKRADQAAERDRQRNEEIAERDHKLEKWVIRLISTEIVLSLLFGFLGLWEGWKQKNALDKQVAVLAQMETNTAKQVAVLAQMETNTAKTATAIQQATASLKTLADEQTKSLEILRRQEADRQAQLGNKPQLLLYVGHVPLTQSNGPFKPREETDTTATFDIVLSNAGMATANNITWRVLVPPDVSVVGYPLPLVVGNDLPDKPLQAFLYFQQVLPAKGYITLAVTFIFPKGRRPFGAGFNANSSDLIGDTPLGVLLVTPRKPRN
jgi:hypothetical protein